MKAHCLYYRNIKDNIIDKPLQQIETSISEFYNNYLVEELIIQPQLVLVTLILMKYHHILL